MQRYYYSRNLQYFCLYFCMKITFFLLISLKCVRTHTLVYSLKHIFRIRISGVSLGVKGVKELKELRQQFCGLEI